MSQPNRMPKLDGAAPKESAPVEPVFGDKGPKVEEPPKDVSPEIAAKLAKDLAKEKALEEESDLMLDGPRAPKVNESKSEKPVPMKVVATTFGFYKRCRKVEGDKFTIDGKHQLAKWMKPI